MYKSLFQICFGNPKQSTLKMTHSPILASLSLSRVLPDLTTNIWQNKPKISDLLIQNKPE